MLIEWFATDCPLSGVVNKDIECPLQNTSGMSRVHGHRSSQDFLKDSPGFRPLQSPLLGHPDVIKIGRGVSITLHPTFDLKFAVGNPWPGFGNINQCKAIFPHTRVHITDHAIEVSYAAIRSPELVPVYYPFTAFKSGPHTYRSGLIQCVLNINSRFDFAEVHAGNGQLLAGELGSKLIKHRFRPCLCLRRKGANIGRKSRLPTPVGAGAVHTYAVVPTPYLFLLQGSANNGTFLRGAAVLLRYHAFLRTKVHLQFLQDGGNYLFVTHIVIDLVTNRHNFLIGKISKHLLQHPLLFINETLRVL